MLKKSKKIERLKYVIECNFTNSCMRYISNYAIDVEKEMLVVKHIYKVENHPFDVFNFLNSELTLQ